MLCLNNPEAFSKVLPLSVFLIIRWNENAAMNFGFCTYIRMPFRVFIYRCSWQFSHLKAKINVFILLLLNYTIQRSSEKGIKNWLLFPAGFEPATLCVWSTRDNHYTMETWMKWEREPMTVNPSTKFIYPISIFDNCIMGIWWLWIGLSRNQS